MATLVPAFENAELFYEMSSKLHDLLDTSFSLVNVWRGLRTELVPKLFGNHYEVIKSTADAGFYRPFSVYTEDKTDGTSPCARLCKKPPKRYLANFKDMVVVDESKREVAKRAITVNEDHRFPVVKRCHYHLFGVRTTKSEGKIRKEIVLQLGGLRKYYTCLPLLHQGDVRVDPKYSGMKLYIVHEVFAVDQMWISTFGDKKDRERNKWEFRGPMPIAVRWREYNADFFTEK